MSSAPSKTTEPADDAPALSDEQVLTEGPTYAQTPKKQRVKWYRTRVDPADLRELSQRSDLLGFAQTLGFLAVLAGSAALCTWFFFYGPWYVTALLVVVNGHLWQFTVNGFHELVHLSVFRTRWLNTFFLRVISFLGWHNHHGFWASHTEHHKYTLHPPDDLEVVQPENVDLKHGWRLLVNERYPWDTVHGTLVTARGRYDLKDRWLQSLFPESDSDRRRQHMNWARVLLVGHGVLLVAALAAGWWIFPLVFTFPKMFGSWLHMLCNKAQHIGLKDNVTDFRVCCRTIYLNPVLQFLYWHMNYHTEHHMYAAVPCYKLGRLHRLIKHDLPHCPRGLVATWTGIADILRRQKQDPDYRYVPQLPSPPK